MNNDSLLTETPAYNWILLGIPVIFFVGTLLHFTYEWSGNNAVVGIFAPVNESVWEHLKLSFWPTLIWWITGFILLYRREGICLSQWFFACMVSEITCILVILSFYYTYTGALGIHSLILDIFSFFLGITIGQLLALHVYKYGHINDQCFYLAVLILFSLAVVFAIFTFYPPNIPLFQVSKSK